MMLVFDFVDVLVVDWWTIKKEWDTGTEEYPIEHRTIWWLQDYTEARQKFDYIERKLGLKRQRTWEKDGRIVFIVSKGETTNE